MLSLSIYLKHTEKFIAKGQKKIYFLHEKKSGEAKLISDKIDSLINKKGNEDTQIEKK